MWAGAVKAATVAWTGVQWLLNASLWGCPVTWIVAGITALIAVITVCVTKVEGWGKQWDSVVKFMKLTGKLFVETIKYEFSTMVNGIMIGLDYIKLGWYKFKKAVGLGDKAENEAMISQISGDIDSRKKAIVDGAKNLKNLAQDAGSSLSWELSWKNGKNGPANAVSPLIAASETPDGTVPGDRGGIVGHAAHGGGYYAPAVRGNGPADTDGTGIQQSAPRRCHDEQILRHDRDTHRQRRREGLQSDRGGSHCRTEKSLGRI